VNKLQNGIFAVITQQWHGNRAIIGLAIFMIAAIRSPVARASLLYSSQSHQNGSCSTRNNECLSFFAESGQESEHQTTPHPVQGKLISAAVQGNLEEVKRLLTQGAEINGTGRAGHTAFRRGTQIGNSHGQRGRIRQPARTQSAAVSCQSQISHLVLHGWRPQPSRPLRS